MHLIWGLGRTNIILELWAMLIQLYLMLIKFQKWILWGVIGPVKGDATNNNHQKKTRFRRKYIAKMGPTEIWHYESGKVKKILAESHGWESTLSLFSGINAVFVPTSPSSTVPTSCHFFFSRYYFFQ